MSLTRLFIRGFIINSIILAVCQNTIWTPAFADSLEEHFRPVVEDRRFEHIEEHMRFGDSRSLSNVRGPNAVNDFRLWIQFFNNNNEERFLPQYIRYNHGIAQEPTLHRIKNVMAPAYLSCMDRALQHCHRNAFNQFSQDYEQKVLQALEEFVQNTTQVKTHFENRFTQHNQKVKELLGPGFVSRAVTSATNADRQTADRVENTVRMMGALKNSAEVTSIIFTGEAAMASGPAAPFVFMLFNLYSAVTGIMSYDEAKDYSVRALAYMKMYLLYDRRILPYVTDMKASFQRPYDALKQRFNEHACWNCGKHGGAPPAESPTAVQEICPQYFQQNGPFARPRDLPTPTPAYGPDYRPPWQRETPP